LKLKDGRIDMEDLIVKLKKYPYLSVCTDKFNSECFITTIIINEVFALKTNKYLFKIEMKGISLEKSISNAYNELIEILNYFIENIDNYNYRINYETNNNGELRYDISFRLTYCNKVDIVYEADSLKGKIEENVQIVKSDLIDKLKSMKESIS